MNENHSPSTPDTTDEPGFFKSIARDDGVQRSIAGVVVAVIVASAKDLIFGKSS